MKYLDLNATQLQELNKMGTLKTTLKNGEEITITYNDNYQSSPSTPSNSETWNPEGGLYGIDSTGKVYKRANSNELQRKNGFERNTLDEAVEASKKIRAYARGLAYADQYAPTYTANFSDSTSNSSIFIDTENKYYQNTSLYSRPSLFEIYFPPSLANRLVAELNNNKVVF